MEIVFDRRQQTALTIAALPPVTLLLLKALPNTLIASALLAHTKKIILLSTLVAAGSVASAIKTKGGEPQPEVNPGDYGALWKRAPIRVECTQPTGERLIARVDWAQLTELLHAAQKGGLPEGWTVRASWQSPDNLRQEIIWKGGAYSLSRPLEEPVSRLSLPENVPAQILPKKRVRKAISWERLSSFIQRHQVQVAPSVMVKMALEGEQLLQQILAGKVTEPKYGDELKIAFLLTLSEMIKEGGAADEVMWKVEDPEGWLALFLSKTKGAYPINSSHFYRLRADPQQEIFVEGRVLPRGPYIEVIPLKPEHYRNTRFVALKLKSSNSILSGIQSRVNYLRGIESGRKEYSPNHKERVCDRPASLTKGLDYLEFRDWEEVIFRVDDLTLPRNYLPLKDSNLPVPEPDAVGDAPLIFREWVPQPNLVKEVLAALPDPVKQINREVAGVAYTIGGKLFKGKSATELLNAIEQELGVDRPSAVKIASLATQGIMSGVTATLMRAPIGSEKNDPDYLLNRTERSPRFSHPTKLTMAIEREGKQVYITASTDLPMMQGQITLYLVKATVQINATTEHAFIRFD
ncbi:MAG: hypothetical protein AB7F31_04920 [Parachlamydiales bacterium]